VPLPDYSDVPFEKLLDVSGRRVVVTGGGRGLGFAIARRFAEGGASVFLADLDGENARAAAGTLGDLPGRAIGLAFDATDPAAHDALARRAVDELGGLDVWVNNAGIFPFNGLLELTDEQWRRVVSLNLDGVLWGCRAAGCAMRDTGQGGCVINMSSTAGFYATGPGLAHYISAKHAVIGLTKSAALELAPHGIRVLALAPTYTATEGIDETMASISGAMGGVDPAEAFAAQVPAGRIGQPDDVARVALFCASSLAGYVTGVTIPVEGGDVAT
jgi:NAD(P)-dependent dehydrogenase (short-subunit alcohol dehydrogenase family)